MTLAATLPQDDPRDLERDDQEHRRGSSGWIGWVISACFHVLLILLMASIYFLVAPPDVDVPPVRVATIEAPPVKEEKPKDERVLEAEVQLEVVAESDHPSPISQLDLPVVDSEREEDTETPVAKGREEAVAESEMGGSGAFMAIGASSGGSGMFGSRSGGGKKRALAKGGGSKGSESAVDAALRWFKRHQDPGGKWDPSNYAANCTENPKCEPGDPAVAKHANAMTGYAVLCFLGAGYDHQTPNKYRETVRKGLNYLVAAQQANGMLGEENYSNAIATMALAEAFAMTGDPALKGAAQRGVDAVVAHQTADLSLKDAKDSAYAAFGWDYLHPHARNDSSVTGWNVMALKSALAGGLNVGNGLEGAKLWLEKVWKTTNPDWAKLDPYTGESVFPYQYSSDQANGGDPHHKTLSCVGALCGVFLGRRAGDPLLETLANYIMNHDVPTTYPCNIYYLYYNTLAMFQVGGERWKKWNSSVRDLLVNAQRKGDGCFDGSWDFKWFAQEGRIMSTAYCCLSLQVYYRYAQVAGNKK
jgi:hypothetical protein